jgi:hypothetical protein
MPPAVTVTNFHLTLFPHWLLPGDLAIPVGGTPQKVELIHLHDPLQTPEDQVMHFGRAVDDVDTA